MSSFAPSFRFFCSLTALLALTIVAGCGGSSDGGAAQRDPTVEYDAWDVYFMQGARVGDGHLAVREFTLGGETLHRSEAEMRMSVRRAGQATETQMKLIALADPDGALRSFESDVLAGGAPVHTRGVVDGDRLTLHVSSGGREQTSEIPWSADVRGFFATEESLRREPMRPGETRSFRALAQAFNVVADVELSAVDLESTRLLRRSRKLLRIESVTRLPDGQSLEATLWTDEQGEILKSELPAAGLTAYRATREAAEDQSTVGEFDLGRWSLVRLDEPLDRPHAAAEVRYRVSLDDADPQQVFVQDDAQQVIPAGPQSADVVVRAVRPDSAPGVVAAPPPTDEDLQPNAYIQSDDPRVVALAAEAAGDAVDPWEVSQRLERFVHDRITRKNYSQALATAAEVARTMEGDCTEHAMLLAALARARGVQARVATGLVYMPSEQAFGYHMWTEVYVDGRWVGLDGTLGLGGLGGGHLKLGRSSLQNASAYSVFLPVLDALGKLKIEAVEVERR